MFFIFSSLRNGPVDVGSELEFGVTESIGPTHDII